MEGVQMVLPLKQQLLAIVFSLGLLLLIVELVRRRKLREEYSFLWLIVGFVVLIVGVWFDFLLAVTRLIGLEAPVSGLFFFGIMFLIVNAIYFSIKISAMTEQVIDLAQENAILRAEIAELSAEFEAFQAGAREN
jgi:hypothetical protein